MDPNGDPIREEYLKVNAAYDEAQPLPYILGTETIDDMVARFQSYVADGKEPTDEQKADFRGVWAKIQEQFGVLCKVATMPEYETLNEDVVHELVLKQVVMVHDQTLGRLTHQIHDIRHRFIDE
jgi:hypothetical protein